MPVQEMLIEQMSELINEINKEGLQKKIDLSKNIIALLYVYLRRLGLSQDELQKMYNQKEAKNEV